MRLTYGLAWLLLGLVASVAVHVGIVWHAWPFAVASLLIAFASCGKLVKG